MNDLFKKSYSDSKESKSLVKITRKSNGLLPSIPRAANDLPNDSHDKLLEKKIWRLLYNFGPIFINDPKGLNEKSLEFNIDTSEVDNTPKDVYQIDGIAIFDNLLDPSKKFIIVQESKSAGKLKSSSDLNSYIDEFHTRKNVIKSRIDRIFAYKMNVIFVLSTKNYKWEPSQKEKVLKDSDIIILSEIEQQYLQDCYDISKNNFFVFNQFLGFFKKSTKCYPKTQVVGFVTNSVGMGEAITFSISAKKMMALTSVSHKRAKNIYQAQSDGGLQESHYQRVLKKKRIGEIGRFLEEKKEPFQNNILVSFRGNRPQHLRTDQLHDKGENRGHLVTIEGFPGTFHVIDGQHRLFGYSGVQSSEILDDHLLIVTAFRNIDEKQEASLFLDVNRNQTKVDTGLMQEVERMIGFSSKGESQVKFMCNCICQDLRDLQESPFFNPKCIKDSEFSRDTSAKMTVADLSTSLKTSGLLGSKSFTRGLLMVDDDYNSTIDFATQFLIRVFDELKLRTSDLWFEKDTLGRKKLASNNILMNYAIGGIFVLIGRFVKHAYRDQLQDIKHSDIEKKIEPYIDHLIEKLNSFDATKLNYFFGFDDINERRKYRGVRGAPYFATQMLVENFNITDFEGLVTADDINQVKDISSEGSDLGKIPNNYKEQEKEINRLKAEIDDLRKAASSAKTNTADPNKNKVAQNYELIFRLLIHKFLKLEFGTNYFNDLIKMASAGSRGNKIWIKVRDMDEECERDPMLSTYPDMMSYCNLIEACDILVIAAQKRDELATIIYEMFGADTKEDTDNEKLPSKIVDKFKWARFLNKMRRFNGAGHSGIHGEDLSDTELANESFIYYDNILKENVLKIESYIKT